MGGSVFPQWIDRARPLVTVVAVLVPLYLAGMAYYATSPETTRVGYCPTQPVPFSHAMHAGELDIDCRYCHNTVERAAMAAVPPTATCMNCHASIAIDSEKLLPLRESAATGDSVRWIRVHDLPDFVYFNHSAHVRRGVGCVTCHGPIDKMDRVYQVAPLSMGWCLDCHRNPAPRLRPLAEITNIDWVPGQDPEVLGRQLLRQYNIPEQAPTDCSTCHR